ncbi:cell division protein FtsI/penicillin-binding protein 2 [Mobilisporobacter senegalensis]|uniref:Cell division protein FtsI/penicillin-binding protein 2 n=2 Tax=Mobilisporobacter senegalensis TaxID=1329262 RepID=A0A3N1XRX9_9FIRM|nr:cell division protein FtsI/penicillin-binding protein 2 [Mobilisporobacter senegalensis]
MNRNQKENNDVLIEENIKSLDKTKNPNREIVMITYIFVGLFVLLTTYFAYFLFADSDEVINNSYNKRQDLLAERVIRGEIQGSNGETLAKTVEDKKGNTSRVYPYDEMFAHIVGRFEKGKTGIESSENFNLLTSHNNPIMMVYNEISGVKNPGDNIITTLDVKLQEVAYNALGSQKGAVVVLEPSTGKILAMVSKPDYDPNEVSRNWEDLTDDTDNNSALVNRATQGLYPPGSTYKILTALEYIRENENTYKDYEYTCSGQGIFDSVSINCYKNEKHGKVDLLHSFSESCNTSFANMGTSLNIGSFRKLNETFLFNRSLPTNIPYKQSSFVLDSHSKKSEVPQTVIGQGKTLVSPFHNALITATIANGGTLMTPYVVDHITNSSGTLIKKNVPNIYGTLMTSKEAKILTQMMEEVVTSGTGSALNGLGIHSAGKTGSAEFNDKQQSHAWFVGFAPTDKPQLVVSIIVEGAGTGSSHAVPIAKKIFQEYFNR